MIDGRAMGVFGAFWRFWGETDPFNFFLPIFVHKILAKFGGVKIRGKGKFHWDSPLRTYEILYGIKFESHLFSSVPRSVTKYL